MLLKMNSANAPQLNRFEFNIQTLSICLYLSDSFLPAFLHLKPSVELASTFVARAREALSRTLRHFIQNIS